MRRLHPHLVLPRAVVLLGLLAFAGCKIIDQTTFAPSPEAVPATAIATVPPRSADPRTPLVTIGFAAPDADYQGLLRYAVNAARARDPAVAFDVVAVAPAQGSPAAQVAAIATGQQDAAGVMRAMMALGVPDTRIHLAARADPAAPARQVRVYVR